MKISTKLTEQEKKAFAPELTKGLALDYFYAHNNAPLNFAYGDGFGTGVDYGVLTDEEARNKVLFEDLWLTAYNHYCVGELYFPFLYLDVQVLQSPLQTYYYEGLLNKPMRDAQTQKYATLDECVAAFREKMEAVGSDFYEKGRNGTPGFEFAILLGSPDRTTRLVNVMPVGNQVIFESILTWSEDSVVKETAYSTCVVYGKDGLVTQDRSYMDMKNWPAHCADWFYKCGFPKRDPALGQEKGYAKDVYAFSKANIVEENQMTEVEARNRAVAETAWAKSANDFDRSIYHADRFRMHLPMQKISYSLDYAEKIAREIKAAVPSAENEILLTAAKGNQVVVESLKSWTDANGVYREIPYIIWLLFDADGKIIRERSYFDANYWPGGEIIQAL